MRGVVPQVPVAILEGGDAIRPSRHSEGILPRMGEDRRFDHLHSIRVVLVDEHNDRSIGRLRRHCPEQTPTVIALGLIAQSYENTNQTMLCVQISMIARLQRTAAREQGEPRQCRACESYHPGLARSCAVPTLVIAKLDPPLGGSGDCSSLCARPPMPRRSGPRESRRPGRAYFSLLVVPFLAERRFNGARADATAMPPLTGSERTGEPRHPTDEIAMALQPKR